MVGDPIRTGGGTAELTTALRADYDAAAADWAGGLTGPGSMYEPLARSLVAAAPVPLAGRLVLDLGAGTGVAGRAALAAGARRVVGGRPVRRHAAARPRRDPGAGRRGRAAVP